jgi:hypothetical protein
MKHDGHTRGRRIQELTHGIEQAKAFLVRLQRHRFGNLRHALAHRGHQPGDGRRAEPEILPQLVRLRGACVGRNRLRKRPVRRRPLALVAPPGQHQGAALRRRLGELLGQARLADSRLARQQHQPAVAGARLFQVVRKLRQLRGAPHEWQVCEQRRRLVGLIENFTGSDRCGEALQLERTTIAKRECRLPGEQARHQPAAQNLSALGALTQPARNRHRPAEVVGLFAERLGDIQADTNRQPLARDAPAGRLLQGDGAVHGVGGGYEHAHQPVAEPPHLQRAVQRAGALQQRVVRPQDALCPLIVDLLQQLGGVHQVGEQHGDRAGYATHWLVLLVDTASIARLESVGGFFVSDFMNMRVRGWQKQRVRCVSETALRDAAKRGRLPKGNFSAHNGMCNSISSQATRGALRPLVPEPLSVSSSTRPSCVK